MAGGVIFYSWPNGRKSVAGGTRGTIKLDRPWQKDIEINSDNCPFCKEGDKENTICDFPEEGWRLRKNLFTPYPFHRMIIPKNCWPVNDLRTLGGVKQIETVLKIAKSEIDQNPEKKLILNVHIGSLAGQNVEHLHYHLCQYMFDDNSDFAVSQTMLRFSEQNSKLIIFENDDFVLIIGGVKAGQCFILPKNSSRINLDLSFKLALILADLITLYNNKFRSVQGLPPDFNLVFLFQSAELKYGLYTPILNHWGAAENISFYENCPVTLPWPHEITAEHLKQK